MFDIGWSEMLIVGALALIVVGPKDLPRMMRSLGRFIGQARGLARQFQRSMEDAARDADISDFKEARELMDDVRKATSGNAISDPFRKIASSVEKDIADAAEDRPAKPDRSSTASRPKPDAQEQESQPEPAAKASAETRPDPTPESPSKPSEDARTG